VLIAAIKKINHALMRHYHISGQGCDDPVMPITDPFPYTLLHSNQQPEKCYSVCARTGIRSYWRSQAVYLRIPWYYYYYFSISVDFL